MENFVLDKYMRMFDLLDIEAKLELLTRLTDNINKSFKKPKKNKEALLDALCGTWSDVDDSIIDDIYSSRTISDRQIDLD